jgi:hypothetical protein
LARSQSIFSPLSQLREQCFAVLCLAAISLSDAGLQLSAQPLVFHSLDELVLFCRRKFIDELENLLQLLPIFRFWTSNNGISPLALSILPLEQPLRSQRFFPLG